jgi:uncharacterized repeat protein (TIGR01451 family)
MLKHRSTKLAAWIASTALLVIAGCSWFRGPNQPWAGPAFDDSVSWGSAAPTWGEAAAPTWSDAPTSAAPGGSIALPGPVTPSPEPYTAERPTVRAPVEPDEAPAASAPELRLSIAAQESVAIGESATLIVELSNAGGQAANVEIAPELPDGVSAVGARPEVASLSAVAWSVRGLAAGESRRFELDVQCDQAGDHNICFSALATGTAAVRECALLVAAAPKLAVKVLGPEEVYLGEEVVFEIVVSNTGTVPAKGILVRDEFDLGLDHEIDGPLERDLDDIAVGKQRKFGVRFLAAEVGRQCNRVTVSATGLSKDVEAEGCVTVLPALDEPASDEPADDGAADDAAVEDAEVDEDAADDPADIDPPMEDPVAPELPPARGKPAAEVTIDAQAPAAGLVGQVALFTIDVTNIGTADLTDVSVETAFDDDLTPQNASPGHTAQTSRRLSWSIAALKPQESVTLEIEARCEEVAEQACCLVTVTDPQHRPATQSACLAIEEPKSNLAVSLVGLKNPVTVGREVNYEVRVANRGQADAADVVVSAEIPEGMSVVQQGTRGPDTLLRGTLDGGRLTFKPAPQLAAGESLIWKIRLRADQAGDVTLRVLVECQGLSAGMSAEEQTTVLPRE